MPPKSGFSRTRNIDYDDDDAYDDDDYYEDEAEGDAGTSADDKEQMRVGTIRVREALAETSDFVSDAQIQEALWHYYYDIAKSVSYLKNKLGTEPTQEKAGPPKKEKPVSRFDQAASVADQSEPTTAGKFTHFQSSYMEAPVRPVTHHHLPLPPIAMPANATITDDFFWDVPWGRVPSDRLGVITIDAPLYRGGLLGGSSKLAALAAKRRRERADADAATAASNGDSDAALAMLDKLTVRSEEAASPSLRGGESESERPARVPRYPLRRRSPSPQPVIQEDDMDQESDVPQPAIIVAAPARRAAASMFASTLCGPSSLATKPSPQLQDFQAPYASYKGYDNTVPFAGPSPDDIVRAAQAKSAGGGRR